MQAAGPEGFERAKAEASLSLPSPPGPRAEACAWVTFFPLLIRTQMTGCRSAALEHPWVGPICKNCSSQWGWKMEGYSVSCESMTGLSTGVHTGHSWGRLRGLRQRATLQGPSPGLSPHLGTKQPHSLANKIREEVKRASSGTQLRGQQWPSSVGAGGDKTPLVMEPQGGQSLVPHMDTQRTASRYLDSLDSSRWAKQTSIVLCSRCCILGSVGSRISVHPN